MSKKISEITQLLKVRNPIYLDDSEQINKSLYEVRTDVSKLFGKIESRIKEETNLSRLRFTEEIRENSYFAFLEALQKDLHKKSEINEKSTEVGEDFSKKNYSIFEIKKIFQGKKLVDLQSKYDLIKVPFLRSNLVLCKNKKKKTAILLFETPYMLLSEKDQIYLNNSRSASFGDLTVRVESKEKDDEQKGYFALSDEQKKLLSNYNPDLDANMRAKHVERIEFQKVDLSDSKYLIRDLTTLNGTELFQEIYKEYTFYKLDEDSSSHESALTASLLEYIGAIAEKNGIGTINCSMHFQTFYSSANAFNEGKEMYKKYSTQSKLINFEYDDERSTDLG
ncbi:MAG: hypothetical protein ACK4NC_03490 [Candidatus Gracilibacteria bacterium]